MIMSQNHTATFFCLLTAIVFLFACQDDPTPIELDVGEQPRDDAASDTASGSDDATDTKETDIEESVEPCTPAEKFEKPPPPFHERLPFHTSDDFTANADAGTSSRHGSRAHAPYPFRMTYLDVGEYFVVDGAWWKYGYDDGEPMDFEVQIVHQGENLPIKFVHVEEVEDKFPSINEIESWDEDDFSDRGTFTFEDEVPVNFTLVIPPWAFDEPAAYHAHLLVRPLYDGSRDWSIGYRNFLSSRFANSLSIHSGSECPPEGTDKPAEPDDARIWEEWDGLPWLMSNYLGVLLVPSPEIYDWTFIEAPSPDIDEFDFGGVHESSERDVTLELYVADLSTEGSLSVHSPLSEGAVYYVLRDDEIIDYFWLETPESSYPEMQDHESPGKKVPIDVELTEEPANYTVYAVPRPFQPITDDSSDIGAHRPQPSMTLRMKYVPDE